MAALPAAPQAGGGGTIKFYVDIWNAANERVGPGPITSGRKWRYTQKLSQAGNWEFAVPAAEPRTEYATLKRFLHCHQFDGSLKWLGGGALEQRRVRLAEVPEMVLSGNDVLFELARYTVRLDINWDSPYIGSAMFAKIMESAPGWTIVVEGATPNLIARFADESILNALITICNKTGQMFRLDPDLSDTGVINMRRIRIFSAPTTTGILATNRAAPLAIERNANACLITDIERQEDAFNLVNQAIPFGAGTGQARFTAYAATLWPDGTSITSNWTTNDLAGRSHTFSFVRATNVIADETSVLAYGAYASQVQFKEITPITNTEPDTIAAANALVAATVQWLLNTSQPQDHYSLSVIGLQQQVYPGQTIRVVARQIRDGQAPINIDQELIIQEVVTDVDENGARPVALTVSTSREFAATDAQVLAREIQKSLAYQAHPQMGPSENTISYREDIDDTYGGSFPFWLSRGTTQVSSVTVRFKLDKLRSTVKSVGGVASGTVSIPNHSHNLSDHSHELSINSSPGGFARLLYIDVTNNGLYYDGVSGPTVATTSDDNSNIDVSGGSIGDVALDLSSAISAVYGIYEDPDEAYTAADLQWTANGVVVTATPTPIVGGWYELDVTSYLISTTTLRPTSQANTVAVAVSNPSEKQVRVTVQIEIRSNIQSIAVV